MLGHMIDTERIFTYRALCIARGEQQSLPGFDENTYADNANFSAQSQQQLLNHYGYVRQSTLALAESLTEEAQQPASEWPMALPISARAFFSILAGHERHHLTHSGGTVWTKMKIRDHYFLPRSLGSAGLSGKLRQCRADRRRFRCRRSNRYSGNPRCHRSRGR
jgi:hypothetical protein